MQKPTPLDEARIRDALSALPHWSYSDRKLHRSFEFPDFFQAWEFLSTCALEAHSRSHPPTWSNSGPIVRMELWTKSAEGVTETDLELARVFEAEARRRWHGDAPTSGRETSE